MSASDWVQARAPAKVNLWLEVLGERGDGYREIDTVMAALDRADLVRARARPAPGRGAAAEPPSRPAGPSRPVPAEGRSPATAGGGIELVVRGPAATPDVPSDERNLAWRAARAVLARAGGSRGLDLEIEKVVPSRAGLGGGSADAAAAWIAAERALGLPPDPAARDATLAALGADCSFFARAAATGLARCTGRGERVQPLNELPIRWNLVVVVPELACSTAAVYRACEKRLCGSEPAPTVPAALFDKSESTVRGALFNRLENAALRAYPELGEVRRWLDQSGADHFRLSGSGSSFFGLYARPDAAGEACRRLERSAGVPLRALFRAELGKGANLLP